MSIYNSSYDSFQRIIFIHCSIQKVFEAWTIPELVSTWFLKCADYYSPDGKLKKPKTKIEVNDRFEWVWHAWEENKLEGNILQLDPLKLLKFTFGTAGDVTLRFSAVEQNLTKIELVQSDIPDQDIKSIKHFYVGCQLGWSFWLTNLKAYLEHGVLLDERTQAMEGNDRFKIVNA